MGSISNYLQERRGLHQWRLYDAVPRSTACTKREGCRSNVIWRFICTLFLRTHEDLIVSRESRHREEGLVLLCGTVGWMSNRDDQNSLGPRPG
jgi:hypothetical protein